MQPPFYAFIDLESPGIDPHDRIFEIALILTDSDYTELARYETVIQPTPESLRQLVKNNIVLDMHCKSGLYAELTGDKAQAQGWPSMETAEQRILQILDEHLPEDAPLAIAGSGVGRYDHAAIDVQMPRLGERLVYWENDPASARRRYEVVTGRSIVPPKPEKTHRAMADIEDDLRYLKAFDEVYRTSQLSPLVGENASERRLVGVALTELNQQFDAFAFDDAGTIVATYDVADSIQHLIKGTNTFSAVAGLMDVATRLAAELAEVRGTDVGAVLDTVRQQVLKEATTKSS